MSKLITIRPTRGNESLVADLEQLAKADNRNLNNYLETVLLAHVSGGKKHVRLEDRIIKAFENTKCFINSRGEECITLEKLTEYLKRY